MFETGAGLPDGFSASNPIFFMNTSVTDQLWLDATGGSSDDAVLIASFEGNAPSINDITIFQAQRVSGSCLPENPFIPAVRT
jgi:hypothetical protein